MTTSETTRMTSEQLNKGSQKGSCSHPTVTITISNRLPEEELDSTSAHIALITCFVGSLLSLRNIDSNNNNTGVPFMLSSVFKCRILAFEAFVISIMFAFSTSFSALLFFRSSRVKVARIFRSCSVLCFASAVTLLLYAICCYPA